ncbi:hypothetical protein P3T36_004690 [Kitasatospora sp. MAP12-15]|uniref:hypothetical protein n=1 Tax=unclassified Kitasatospora TaxID=2633591 RepID=UPI002476E15E|nr:hypothetical protein [Kitasatospora sp. MAP12-44]MDH6111536.1 hypothetical protein [Kitasatospora sp. MAP12-44]
MSQPTIYSPKAARQLDAVTVELAKARAARERAEADAAAQAVLRRSERERQEALAELGAAAEAEHDRRRKQRRAERAQRWARHREVLTGRAVLLATLAVIALCVTVALPAQIGFLAQRWPLPMALAGGIALEALTWVFALQGRARDARGLSAAVHHAGIWAAATVAAGINLTHGAQMWGAEFAVVAASGSLAAPVTWHMYLFSQRQDESDPRQAQRGRRRHHRKVARTAGWLASALPTELTPDELWTLAWRAVHGAEPGITAELLDAHAKASALVAKHLRPGGLAGLDVLTRPAVVQPTLPTVDARDAVEAGFAAARPVAELLRADSARTPLQLGRTRSYKQVTGRTALRPPPRTTPLPAAPDGQVMEAKRQAARAVIRRTLAGGGSPSPTGIGRAHGMSPEWGAKQIRAVRMERQSASATEV